MQICPSAPYAGLAQRIEHCASNAGLLQGFESLNRHLHDILMCMMELKICSCCRELKEITEFNFKNKAKGKRQPACKICTREQTKRHYEQNVPYYVEKAARNNKSHIDGLLRIIFKHLLEHPCVDCGETNPGILQFDHIRGEKSFNVANYRTVHNKAKLIEEIAKCDIRCANCHILRHLKARNAKILRMWEEYLRSKPV